MTNKRVLFVISEDWALITHRLHLVEAAITAGYEVGLATRITKYESLLKKHDIKIYNWNLERKSLNPFLEIMVFFNLCRILWLFKPNIIHAVAQKPLIYSGIAIKFYNKKIGFTGNLGGLGYVFTSKSIKATLLRPLVKLLLKISLTGRRTKLILQNNDNIKVIKELNIVKGDDIRLVRGAGVEIDKFLPTPIPQTIPKIILPARLLWDKGIGEFIRVASKIKSRKIKALFQIVGDVDPHNPLSIPQSQINQWVGSGVVMHLGRKHDMNAIYKNASIICLPSYNEGLPKALLEGASCGKPLVAFDVPGCREIVIDNLNGILVKFGDETRLEKALVSLIKNKKLCEKMGKKGREIVEINFSDKVINAQTLNIWKELM